MGQGERHGALEDLLVLDLGRVLTAPFCASMLADMGARVIKIEQPGKGEDARRYGPFVRDGRLVAGDDGNLLNESAYFGNLNRNKEGITIDLKQPEGREIFLRLAERADVVIENFRPGVMDRLGLGYEVLAGINPRLVYLSISGFGSFGRYSGRPGYDLLAQAAGGLMSITGPEGGEPLRAGTAVGDMTAGINGAMGILAALHARTLTGRGQKVDVSLLDSVVVLMENYLTRARYSGKTQGRIGNSYPAIEPAGSFRAKDGDFVMVCGNDGLFRRLAEAAGHEEWLTDPRYSGNKARLSHKKELHAEIEAWSSALTVKEVTERCLEAGLPAGEIKDLLQVMEDEHIAEDRGMFPEVCQPYIGVQKVNGWAVKMSDTPCRIYKGAPALGEDSGRILKEFLCLDEDEIRRLRDRKII